MSSFLQSYKRQPKLFIDLPSNGAYYDDTIIEDAKYTQIPVFGMNAMDEILFKTPDALFTGEATAEVVKSCIPSILDPWKIVGFDIDYILLAIRIATYGDDMQVSTTCPKCETETESMLSLTNMIGAYSQFDVSHKFELDELTFHLRPLSYKEMTDFSIENYTYERQQIQIASNTTMDNKEKDTLIKQLYDQSETMNLRVALTYIKSVGNSVESETNLDIITAFVTENDAKFYNELKENIFELSNRWKVPNTQCKCSNEECNWNYETKIDLDYSNFFGLKFLHARNLI